MTLNMRRRQDGHENFRDDKVNYRRLRATASFLLILSIRFLILLRAKQHVVFFSFFDIQPTHVSDPSPEPDNMIPFYAGGYTESLYDYTYTPGLL